MRAPPMQTPYKAARLREAVLTMAPLTPLLALLVVLAAPALASAASEASCLCSWRVTFMSTCLDSGIVCSVSTEDDDADWVSSEATRQAVAEGLAAAEACANASLERDSALELRHPLTPFTPEYHHGIRPEPVAVPNFRALTKDRCAAQEVVAAVADANGLTIEEVGAHLPELLAAAPSGAPTDTLESPCNASAKYRSIDGSCNNLLNLTWGQTNRVFQRLLCPVYSDGVWEPPRARDGGELPSPRLVRQLLLPDTPPEGSFYPPTTLIAMQWGQVVAHDSLLTFDLMGAEGFSALCCQYNESTPQWTRFPLEDNETASICLASNGPDNYCESIVRGNVTFVRPDGTLGPGEQVNGINSYLDASFVYGNDENFSRSLRTLSGGLLATTSGNYPPQSQTPDVDCNARYGSEVCFVGGDPRINQNSLLTSMQVVFLREHNRVATQLSATNPQWDDDTLYEEARRIVGAEFQHITYSELVPLYVGVENAEKLGLLSNSICEYDSKGYNPKLEATVFNEFATASYRVFHGIAQSVFQLFDAPDGCPAGQLLLHDWMTTPVIVERELDRFIRTLSLEPIQEPAQWTPVSLGNHIFESNQSRGQDLGSFDVQRSRDHGLPSYCDYLQRFFGSGCDGWDDLTKYIPYEVVWKLQNVYKDPNDVEFYVGMFLETPRNFALTGPTAIAMNAEQFSRWKFGDRFFYNFKGQAGSFTPDQLCEIKKVTASRLFCDNGNNITSIQRNVFYQPSFWNPILSCDDIPSPNFSAWKE